MVNIQYVNHLNQIVDLSKLPFYIQEPEKLFGYEWQYTSTSKLKSLTNFTKDIVTKDCTLTIFADSQKEYDDIMNNFLSIVEADITNESPGRFIFNGYYMECYIVASEINEWEEDFYSADKQIKIVAENGTWIKEIPLSLRWQEQPEDISGIDYPYDYSYNYCKGSGFNSIISTESFGDMDFLLTIYGYADSPEVSIGSNTYRINYTIQKGERLIINSRNRTVTLIKTNGVVFNLFRYRDSRHYIFEKISSGELPVYWNSAFDFDITMYEERSEPRWM